MGFLNKLKSFLKKPSSPKATPVEEFRATSSPKASQKSPDSTKLQAFHKSSEVIRTEDCGLASPLAEALTESLDIEEVVVPRAESPPRDFKASPAVEASVQKSVKFCDDVPKEPKEQESKPKVKIFLAPVQARSQSPDALEEETVKFDVTMDQIYPGISEAFGQMIAASLQSAKWDKRSQAIKAINTVLKGLDLQGLAPPGSTGVLGKGLRLRDRARCWRLSCQLMHHVMRDKVMPVRMAAFDLFMDTFSNTDGMVSQAEAHFAVNILLEHIMERLGDSNVRLHESAQKCVLLAAERPGLIGLSAVLSKLLARLSSSSKGGERSKVHFGMIDTVAFLLQHFPGRKADDAQAEASSWTLSEVTPFILAGMEDDALGPRVRNSAVALAVSVYQTYGSDAMQPLMARLRPAKQALLKQKFEDAEEDLGGECRDDRDGANPEEEDGDDRPDLSGMMICGKAVAKQSGKAKVNTRSPAPFEEEECLMDGILEDAGMVFSGSDMIKEEYTSHSKNKGHLFKGPSTGASLPGMCDGFPEEFWQIEQELASLGFDFEGLDEQQALLSSLVEASRDDRRDAGRRALSVY